MSSLRVRVYDVRFGDAVLVTVPDRFGEETTRRHLLIDVGNIFLGAAGDDAAFEPVVKDIQQELGGDPIDLYVMTHEHLDHVQGLLHASRRLGIDLKADYAWLTASADPDYYDKPGHEDAKREKKLALANYALIERYVAAAPAAATALGGFLLNNNPRKTSDCVDYLRTVAPKQRTYYVHRQTKLKGKHSFKEAKLRLWAPEENTAIYYGKFQPLAVVAGGRAAAVVEADPLPPPGVDAGAFYALVDARRRGIVENMLAIDAAANNSSIVFTLEWRGWKLLFPGDAEVRSWQEMGKRKLLGPVHFLKIAHHGSGNGTPPDELLERVLPAKPKSKRARTAAVSTHPDGYPGVPSQPALDRIGTRAKVKSTTKDLKAGQPYFDIFFAG